ncbi:hypothetical protein FACS1894133_3470 [Clostridia bacterium]|nr:hypothetical protein FACS1894133_3470 [Clostridia bacterium]
MYDIICSGALFALFELLHFRAKGGIRAVLMSTAGGVAALVLCRVALGAVAVNVYTIAVSALLGVPGAVAVSVYPLLFG